MLSQVFQKSVPSAKDVKVKGFVAMRPSWEAFNFDQLLSEAQAGRPQDPDVSRSRMAGPRPGPHTHGSSVATRGSVTGPTSGRGGRRTARAST